MVSFGSSRVGGVPGHEKYDSKYVLAQWPVLIQIPPAGGIVKGAADLRERTLFDEHYRETPLGHIRVDRLAEFRKKP